MCVLAAVLFVPAALLSTAASPSDSRPKQFTDRDFGLGYDQVVLWLHPGAAVSLSLENKCEAAERLARSDVAEAESRYGPDAVQTARALDQLGVVLGNECTQGPSALPDAMSALMRALRIKERARIEGIDFARTLHALGEASAQHGAAHDLREAADYWRRALPIIESNSDAHDLGLAALMMRAGDVVLPLAPLESKEYFRRALAIVEDALGSQHPAVAQVLYAYAKVDLHYLGNPGRAKPLVERELRIWERALGRRDRWTARAINQLGVVYAHLGDYDAATSLYEEALDIRLETMHPDAPEIRQTRNNLADIYVVVGDLPRARQLFEEVLRDWKREYKPNDSAIAIVLGNLGDVALRGRDPHAARILFEQALTIWDTYVGSGWQRGQGLVDLGRAQLAEGDDLGARASLERASSFFRGAPSSASKSELLELLARLDLRAGNLKSALGLAEYSLEIRERELGPTHPSAASSLLVLADVLAASEESPTRALEALQRAQSILRDHFRLSARSLPHREALTLSATYNQVLGRLTTLAWDSGNPTVLRAALDELVRSRALALDEMARRNQALAGTDAPETRALAAQLDAAMKRLFAMYVSTDDWDAAQRELLRRTADEKERLERDLAHRSMAFQRRADENSIGLSEVQCDLPRDSVLVSILQYEQQRAGREVGQFYAAFVTGPRGDVALVDLGPAPEMNQLIADWRREVGRTLPPQREALRRAEEDYRRVGALLRRRLWDPLAPLIAGARQVLVVPDGAVSLVDLPALPIGESLYLVEQPAVLHSLSSERDVVRFAAPAVRGKGLLALAAPDFDHASSTPVGSIASLPPPSIQASDAPSVSRRGGAQSCAEFRSMAFRRLPLSGEEARDVADAWRRSEVGRRAGIPLVLLGSDASEASFRRLAPGRRVLHIASHGFVLGPCTAEDPTQLPPENPLLLSGVALAGANRRPENKANPPEDDGILTAEEIATLDLSNVEWAVLSACDSGAGVVQAGEGVLGLRRAFQIAGARTLIMAMWDVPDDVPRDWMRAMYTVKVAGATTAAAVREATLRMLKRVRDVGSPAHPALWGAFIASGDWR